ncbi:MAG TPA: hypothetical protein VJ965_03600, partial [Anaerolineales bacterium]|nr:hypothetical protein [Anaerolineales bacterium]
MKKILLPFLLFVLLSACAAAQPSPTQPTSTPVSLPADPTPTEITGERPTADQAGECQLDAEGLAVLRSALPYEQAALAPLNYGGERSLVVWFASPTLDGQALDAERGAEGAAISLAVQAAKDLLAASSCLAEIDSLSFHVTDGSY